MDTLDSGRGQGRWLRKWHPGFEDLQNQTFSRLCSLSLSSKNLFLQPSDRPHHSSLNPTPHLWTMRSTSIEIGSFRRYTKLRIHLHGSSIFGLNPHPRGSRTPGQIKFTRNMRFPHIKGDLILNCLKHYNLFSHQSLAPLSQRSITPVWKITRFHSPSFFIDTHPCTSRCSSPRQKETLACLI